MGYEFDIIGGLIREKGKTLNLSLSHSLSEHSHTHTPTHTRTPRQGKGQVGTQGEVSHQQAREKAISRT